MKAKFSKGQKLHTSLGYVQIKKVYEPGKANFGTCRPSVTGKHSYSLVTVGERAAFAHLPEIELAEVIEE